jgi:peroxiredoxin
MQRFYAGQQAAHKDFVVLGVNAVDDAATAQQFAQQKGMTYPIMIDSGQYVASLYGITDTPTSFFIDRNGIIRATQVGPVDDNTLNKEAELL